MFDFFRKNIYLVIFIIILIVVGFALTDLSQNNTRGGSDRSNYLQLGGVKYSKEYLDKKGREFSIGNSLRLSTMPINQSDSDKYSRSTNNYGFYNVLINGNQFFLQNNYSEFVVNSIILENKSIDYGVEPSIKQAIEQIKNIPTLQTNKQFDSKKLNELEKRLSSFGLSEESLVGILKNWLKFQKITEIVSIGISPSEKEIEDNLKKQSLKYKMVIFYDDPSSNLNEKSVKEERVKSYFSENASNFMTEEKRSFKYVFFPYPDGYDKLESKAKDDAHKDIYKKSGNFFDMLSDQENPIDFESAAKKLKLEVIEHKLITSKKNIKSPSESNEAKKIAFSISKDKYTPKKIQGKGYLVVMVTDVKEPEPLSYKDAKDKIKKILAYEDAKKLSLDKMKKLRKNIIIDLEQDKTTDKIAISNKIKLFKQDEFTRESLSQKMKYRPNKDLLNMYNFSKTLKVGEVSQVTTDTSRNLASIFYLESVKDTDKDKVADKEVADKEVADKDKVIDKFKKNREAIIKKLNSKYRENLFLEWLRQQREKLKIEWKA